MTFTWEIVAAFLGVAGIIAGTLVTIFRKNGQSVSPKDCEKKNEALNRKLAEMETRISILESKYPDVVEGLQEEIHEMKAQILRLEEKIENLTMLLLKWANERER